jgi:hypothetical protein
MYEPGNIYKYDYLTMHEQKISTSMIISLVWTRGYLQV